MWTETFTGRTKFGVQRNIGADSNWIVIYVVELWEDFEQTACLVHGWFHLGALVVVPDVSSQSAKVMSGPFRLGVR